MVHSSLLRVICRILAPHLAKRNPGYIINIGSQAGLHASKGNAAYAASKWGMTGWSQSCFEVRLPM